MSFNRFGVFSFCFCTSFILKAGVAISLAGVAASLTTSFI
jgi:hypothetical protein